LDLLIVTNDERKELSRLTGCAYNENKKTTPPRANKQCFTQIAAKQLSIVKF
jgi:hypothetical protein